MGLLSILYDTYYLWIIFMSLLALPFFMFGLLCYIYGNVRVEMISSTHIAGKDEKIPVTLHITNRTIFPIPYLRIFATYQNLYSSNEIAKVIYASAESRSSSTIVCNLSSYYAGNIVINLKDYRIYDYLKLFSIKRKMERTLKAAVLPHYYELESFNSRNQIMIDSDNYSPHKSGDDPSEVLDIRDYREGDRPQRIHWKLSIKADRLMIKEFSDPVDCLDVLFVSLCLPDGVNMLYYLDSILECVLSISYTFMLKKQPHYIAWYDAVNGGCMRVKVENEKDFYDAVDGLLNIKPYHTETDSLVAYLAEYPYEQYTDFIYITGSLLASQLDKLALMKAQSKYMILLNEPQLLAQLQTDGKDMRKTAAEMGVDFLPVDISNVKNDLELYIA